MQRVRAEYGKQKDPPGPSGGAGWDGTHSSTMLTVFLSCVMPSYLMMFGCDRRLTRSTSCTRFAISSSSKPSSLICFTATICTVLESIARYTDARGPRPTRFVSRYTEYDQSPRSQHKGYRNSAETPTNWVHTFPCFATINISRDSLRSPVRVHPSDIMGGGGNHSLNTCRVGAGSTLIDGDGFISDASVHAGSSTCCWR